MEAVLRGRPSAVSLLARLCRAAGEGWAGATIRGALARRQLGIVVVEQHGFEALAHVPFDMAGKHAEEDMGAHPWGEPKWWIGRRCRSTVFVAAEGALDPGETLIGADDAFGGQGVVCEAGADDIKPVEPGLGGDASVVAGKAEAVFGDGDVEQLGLKFVAVLDAAGRRARSCLWPLGPVPRAS